MKPIGTRKEMYLLEPCVLDGNDLVNTWIIFLDPFIEGSHMTKYKANIICNGARARSLAAMLMDYWKEMVHSARLSGI
jgi:hypothetical protein